MIARAGAVIKNHIETHRRRGKWSFFWRISIEGLLIPLLVAAVLEVVFHLPGRSGLDRWEPFRLFVWVVILAPFFETLLLQTLPAVIARRCGLGFWGQIMASLLPFAAVHFPDGLATGICAGVVGGFYMAFTYMCWRQVSFRSALWMTSGLHALHNLLLLLAAMATGEI